MEFIINYWYLLIAGIAVLIALVYVGWKFFKMPSNEQLAKIKEWLLYAVTKAEKELGSGTGKLKLRYVYDLFIGKFTWVAKVITFEQFSYLVDEALDEMRDLLETNKAIATLVGGETTGSEEMKNE